MGWAVWGLPPTCPSRPTPAVPRWTAGPCAPVTGRRWWPTSARWPRWARQWRRIATSTPPLGFDQQVMENGGKSSGHSKFWLIELVCSKWLSNGFWNETRCCWLMVVPWKSVFMESGWTPATRDGMAHRKFDTVELFSSTSRASAFCWWVFFLNFLTHDPQDETVGLL